MPLPYSDPSATPWLPPEEPSSQLERAAHKKKTKKKWYSYGKISSSSKPKQQQQQHWLDDDDDYYYDQQQQQQQVIIRTMDHISTDEASSQASQLSSTATLERPAKPLLLGMFDFLEFVAIVAALRLMATQIFPLFMIPITQFGVVELAVRFYISLFCIAICLNELEAPIPFFQQSRLLQAYLSRGLLYSFLALAAMDEAFAVKVQDTIRHSREVSFIPWVAIFTQMSSYPVLVVGHVYVLLGVICGAKTHRDRLKQEYRERMEEYNKKRQEVLE